MRKIVFVLALSAMALLANATEVEKTTKRKPSQVTGQVGFSSLSTKVLKCTGTEPFWNLEINGSKMVYSDPVMNSKVTFKVSERIVPNGTSDTYALAIKASKGSNNVVATIRAGDCNDGMSDESYEYDIFFVTKGAAYIGCCGKK